MGAFVRLALAVATWRTRATTMVRSPARVLVQRVKTSQHLCKTPRWLMLIVDVNDVADFFLPLRHCRSPHVAGNKLSQQLKRGTVLGSAPWVVTRMTPNRCPPKPEWLDVPRRHRSRWRGMDPSSCQRFLRLVFLGPVGLHPGGFPLSFLICVWRASGGVVLYIYKYICIVFSIPISLLKKCIQILIFISMNLRVCG